MSAVILITAGCGNRERPNLVLVVVDTLRADHLQEWGYERATSPNLQRIFHGGVVFENCLTPAPLTDTAFASLLTARYPADHGVRDTGYRLVDGLPTLAEELRADGYHTAAIFSRVGLAGAVGLGRGFDVADDDTVAPGEAGPYAWNTRRGAEMWQRRAWEVTDRAMSWLDEREEEPFFLLLHYFDPHAYYDPKPPFAETFTPTATPYDDLDLVSWWGPVESLGAEIARYDEEILTVDSYLGQFVDELRRRDLWDNSIFILTADHGESLGEHGVMDHGEWLYQEQIHVPLILRIPSLSGQPARRIPQMVRLIDIMPTVLDLLGVDHRPDSEGRPSGVSLLPLIRGESQPVRPLLLETENCPSDPDNPKVIGVDCFPPGVAGKMRGVSDGRFKLVVMPTHTGVRRELFDLEADPGELHDIAPTRPDVVARLLEVMRNSIGPEIEGSVDEETVDRLKALGYAD